MSAEKQVPVHVRTQAQAMADSERCPHYIIDDGDSWLISPERPYRLPDAVIYPVYQRERRIWQRR